jgi:putative membrane protein
MRNFQRYGAVIAMGSALMLGACGGNDAATTDSAAPGTVSAGDSAGMMAGDSMAGMNHSAGGALSEPNIVAMIGLSNAAEIQTSTIAQDKATNAEVKAFARDMIREHKAMQAQADSLTAKNNMQPQAPAQGDQKQQMVNTATQQLQSTAKGAEFDRAYMTAQVQMHQQTLTELQSYQGMVQNAELRAMIEKAIPAVQQHLQRAQTIQGQLGS